MTPKNMTYTIAAVCNHDGVCEDCTTYETMGDIPSVHDALDEAWSARDELEDTKDEYGLEQLEYLVFDEGFEIDRAGNRL
ncbi:MAG: hypothetical protein KKD44_29245 [Proteobacteria bacterium]|nr:hypothetical protein [Pseudomonadota bacterium]